MTKRKVGVYEVDDNPIQTALCSGPAPKGLAATGVNRLGSSVLESTTRKGTGKGKAGAALDAGFTAALMAINCAVGLMSPPDSAGGASGSAGSGAAGSASGCAADSALRQREAQLARWAGSRLNGSASHVAGTASHVAGSASRPTGSAGWSPAQAAAAAAGGSGGGGGGGGGGGYNWRANPAYGAITWDDKIAHAFWQLNKNGKMRRYSIHHGRRRRCRSISDSDTGSTATEPED